MDIKDLVELRKKTHFVVYLDPLTLRRLSATLMAERMCWSVKTLWCWENGSRSMPEEKRAEYEAELMRMRAETEDAREQANREFAEKTMYRRAKLKDTRRLRYARHRRARELWKEHELWREGIDSPTFASEVKLIFDRYPEVV